MQQWLIVMKERCWEVVPLHIQRDACAPLRCLLELLRKLTSLPCTLPHSSCPSQVVTCMIAMLQQWTGINAVGWQMQHPTHSQHHGATCHRPTSVGHGHLLVRPPACPPTCCSAPHTASPRSFLLLDPHRSCSTCPSSSTPWDPPKSPPSSTPSSSVSARARAPDSAWCSRSGGSADATRFEGAGAPAGCAACGAACQQMEGSCASWHRLQPPAVHRHPPDTHTHSHHHCHLRTLPAGAVNVVSTFVSILSGEWAARPLAGWHRSEQAAQAQDGILRAAPHIVANTRPATVELCSRFAALDRQTLSASALPGQIPSSVGLVWPGSKPAAHCCPCSCSNHVS